MATLIDSVAAVDPGALYRSCADNKLPAERWLGKANAFALEPGRGPGRGHVLLKKSDLDSLDATADHALTFSGTGRYDPITLLYVTILSAECVDPGSASDPDATYLVEVVDRRHHLGRVPLPDGYKGYNVAAADGASFLSATKNGGTTWTWQGVVNDLATTLGESAAAFALPFTPDNQPENLSFDGVGAWEALNRVLDRLACAAAYDPTTDAFSVVRLGVDQDAALDAVAAEKTWDGYCAEYARGWRPEKVRVRFLRRPQPSDGASPYYVKDVTLAAAAGVKAGTFVTLDDDLTALGASGAPTNASLLDARAQERADDWLRKRLYYERPVLTVWEDFIPEGPGLGGHAAGRVVFDDRGGPFQTAALAKPDGRAEAFRPLGDWPPWWPFTAGGALSSGSANMGSGYDIAADGTWEDTGLTLTLPSAGTYLVTASVLLELKFTDGANLHRINARLYDSTNSFPVYAAGMLAHDINNSTLRGSVPLGGPWTVTGSAVIKLQAFRANASGGAVWSVARVLNAVDAMTQTQIRYVKIA